MRIIYRLFFLLLIVYQCSSYDIYCQKEKMFSQALDQWEQEDICPRLYRCDTRTQICVHQGLYPLTFLEIIGYILNALFLGLCQAGGVGGGPIVMPMLQLFNNYESRKSQILSFLIVFAGTIGNVVRNTQFQNEQGIPFIVFDLVIMGTPVIMSGAVLGTRIGRFLPEIVMSFILFLVVAQKYYDNRRNEIIAQQNRLRNLARQSSPKDPFLNDDEEDRQYMYVDQYKIAVLNEFYVIQREQYPNIQILKILITIFIVIVCNLFRGSRSLKSILGIEVCGYGYHLIEFFLLFLMLVLTVGYFQIIVDETKLKKLAGYNFQTGNPEITAEIAQNTVFSCFFAGTLAGMIGLGSSFLIAPVFISFGVPPIRARSTGIMIGLFASFVPFSLSLQAGYYSWSEIIFLGSYAAITTYYISGEINDFVNKRQRRSALLLAIIIILLISVVILPINAIISLLADPHSFFRFGPMC